MAEKDEKTTLVDVPEETAENTVAEPEDPIDKVCAALWKLYDKKALLEAIKRGYVGVDYFKRLVARGADWKIALIQSAYSPILLELFRLSGVNLRFRNDALLNEIIKRKFWNSLEYLIKFAGVPVDINQGQLFLHAFDIRDQDLLSVLLSASVAHPTLWVGQVGEALARSGWWEGIRAVSLSPHFANVIRDTPLFKEACLAGAKHLVFSILMSHAFTEPPSFSEEEVSRMEPLIVFAVRQFLKVAPPAPLVAEAPLEDPLPPPPLQPQLFENI